MKIGVDQESCIRKGSRLRCISKDVSRGDHQLTVGNVYEALNDSYWSYGGCHLVQIKNDVGDFFHYEVVHFEVQP